MRRVLCLVLSCVIIALSLAGCGTYEEEPPFDAVPDPVISSTPTTVPTTAPTAAPDYGLDDSVPAYVVTPFATTVKARIASRMPEYTFVLTGEVFEGDWYYDGYEGEGGRTIYTRSPHVQKITILDGKGRMLQELNGLDTEYIYHSIYWDEDDFLNTDFSEIEYLNFEFTDWNFDGYLDISLQKWEGGSMRNVPCYFWLWDAKKRQFIEQTQMEIVSEYSGLYAYPETQTIEAYTRDGGWGYWIGTYKFFGDEFTLIRNDDMRYEVEDNGDFYEHLVTEELINGEMVVTEDLRKRVTRVDFTKEIGADAPELTFSVLYRDWTDCDGKHIYELDRVEAEKSDKSYFLGYLQKDDSYSLNITYNKWPGAENLLIFGDWNQDGYLDVALRTSGLMKKYLYWLWDNDLGSIGDFVFAGETRPKP